MWRMNYRNAPHDEIVPFRFYGHASGDCLMEQLRVSRVIAPDLAQVYQVFLAQAKQQSSFAGDSNPVARVAETVAVRGNKADPGTALPATRRQHA